MVAICGCKASKAEYEKFQNTTKKNKKPHFIPSFGIQVESLDSNSIDIVECI